MMSKRNHVGQLTLFDGQNKKRKNVVESSTINSECVDLISSTCSDCSVVVDMVAKYGAL